MARKPHTSISDGVAAAMSWWSVREAIVLEADRATEKLLRDAFKRHSTADIEVVRTADDLLDTLGGNMRRFGLLMLGCGRTSDLAAAAHVMTVLRKSSMPLVALAYKHGAPPPEASWPRLVGIADWLNLDDDKRWPVAVQRALDRQATVARIMTAGTVPRVMASSASMHLYNADPGLPFAKPKD